MKNLLSLSDHIAGGADRSTTMTMEEVTDNDRDVMSNLQGNRADLNVRDEITFWILPIAAAVGAVAGLGLVSCICIPHCRCGDVRQNGI